MLICCNFETSDFANLGKDEGDRFQESERAQALYAGSASPGENPLKLKSEERIKLKLGCENDVSHLAKLTQTENKEDARRTR